MKYLSVCSGVEAATVAWQNLSWKPVAFSEIEAFPSEVLAHHYPNVPNLGDMTKYKEWNFDYPIDVLVGGTPCQSFSTAGLRKGLEDPRGNLALTYCGILDRFKPRWFIWENVPGVLSSNGGRDFGSFLGAVAELGYGFAYRVLDAQHFGVPQRRRRTFVVGCHRDWRSAGEVLFHGESVARIPAPLHKVDPAGPRFFMPGNRAIDRGSPETLGARDYKDPQIICSEKFVRKLMPLEYERLLGFPDGYTALSAATKDTPRYKALGNSMAVPVMRWIGERVNLISNKFVL